MIVAHSPTQGLDLAATAAVHNTLIEAAGRGAAVIVISADLDELIAIADRMVVLSAGKIVDEFDLRSEAFDAARIGKAMAVGQQHGLCCVKPLCRKHHPFCRLHWR